MVKSSTKNATKIPRPKNCFILFRLDMQSKISELCPGANHRDISRIIAKWWREAPDSEHEYYRELAKQEKIQHAKMYPDYKYNPTKRTVATRPYRKRAAHEFTSLDVQKNEILSKIFNEKRKDILTDSDQKPVLLNVEYASPATSYNNEYLSPSGSQLLYSDSLSDSAPDYSPSNHSYSEYAYSTNCTVKEENTAQAKYNCKSGSTEVKEDYESQDYVQESSGSTSSVKQNVTLECSPTRSDYTRGYIPGHNLSPLSNYYNPSQVNHYGYHPAFYTANPKHLLMPFNYHNYAYAHPVPQAEVSQIPVDYINLNYYNQYQYK